MTEGSTKFLLSLANFASQMAARLSGVDDRPVTEHAAEFDLGDGRKLTLHATIRKED